MLRRFTIIIILLLAFAQVAGAADYVLITLLHTNDLHGRIMSDKEPGLARTAALIKQVRADMPNVILIDAGDIIHGSYEDYLSNGKASITAMNSIGYNAAVPGNHEFDFGLVVTRDAIGTATFPFLAANVTDRTTGQNWDKTYPYVTIIAGGARIGIIGLVTPDTIALQWPASVADIRIENPFETAKAFVPTLKGEVDALVVLSHLGHSNDLKLAVEVPGIDFIIGGHSHTTVDKWQWVGDTFVAQAGAYSKYLGRIDFIIAIDENGSRIASVNGKEGRLWNNLTNPPLGKVYPVSPIIAVSKSLPYDESVVAAYLPYRERAVAALDEVIGQAMQDIHDTQVAAKENPAANLVADAIRSAAKSDVAVVDAGSVRSGLAQGPLKLRDAYDMISGFTRQRLVVVRMKGSELRKTVSNRFLKGNSLRLHISGMAIDYKTEPIEITKLEINGVPFDSEKEYTVAGQAYIIQEFMRDVPSAQVVVELTESVREAIAQYIRTEKAIKQPEMGRIRAQ